MSFFLSHYIETILQLKTQAKGFEDTLQTNKELAKNEERSLKDQIALKVWQSESYAACSVEFQFHGKVHKDILAQ